VAPGPVWTPLIPSSFPPEKTEKFGGQVPMGRAGEPSEIATSYVFLASNDASYFTGQCLHPNGTPQCDWLLNGRFYICKCLIFQY
jgi:NAD(P)-dependent dehydrogenase (short-subunit alcohol dehydrogenase family)